MKFTDFEARVESTLRELCSRIPFLSVKSMRRNARIGDTQSAALMTIEAKNRRWIWVIEAKNIGQPRVVRTGVLQIRSFLSRIKHKNRYGIFVAPFISAESARLCIASDIGYVDLAGNARLSFDQVFIETRAADNPFQEKRHLRSVFGAKSGRVLRALLTPPLKAWKVKELQDLTGVSLGQVSNVRRSLLDQEWAILEENGLRLQKPEELARAWLGSYEPRPRSRATAYTLLHDQALENAIRAAMKEAGDGAHLVLASYSAAQWLAPFARHATRFFYADKKGAELLSRHLKLDSVERGENVVVLEPREDDVFAARIEAAPGIWCSGLVQTWLDLSSTGERGIEAAEHLLQERLLPAWRASSS